MSAKKRRGSRAQKQSGKKARKKTISSADIHRAIKLLGLQSSQMAAIAAQMTEHSLEEIEIDGAGLFDRGVDEIGRYIDNLNKGAAKARREKESFSP